MQYSEVVRDIVPDTCISRDTMQNTAPGFVKVEPTMILSVTQMAHL